MNVNKGQVTQLLNVGNVARGYFLKPQVCQHKVLNPCPNMEKPSNNNPQWGYHPLTKKKRLSHI